MSIQGLEAVQSAETTITTTQSKTLGKEDFLYLLVNQLKAQDPLNPMESTEFTAQLAQFSSLEELGQINDSLEYLQLYQASSNNAQAVGFIGREVEAIDNALVIDDGTADDIHFNLAGDADAVFGLIYNSDGQVVRILEYGGYSSGKHDVSWDGRDNAGGRLPDGEYTVELSATDADGESVGMDPFIRGRVTGVFFNDGVTYLIVDDKEVAIGAITKVSET
ncbi:MAG: flagellar hook assembly protein FlgD [Deltaproteobacteria bacterium]|nr:flagellar hook assembly protein FlgD [Deltaproteobacteria bacterium]